MFSPVKNLKVYQQVVSQIQDMVLNGVLCTGDKLPTERALAEQFQVSRASIREALRALEIIGVIESRQGDGNFITANFSQAVFEPLSVMFHLSNGTFKDILEFRMLMEIEASSLAAQRINDKQKEELQEILAKLKDADSEKIKSKYDLELHYKIADITGNFLIINMLNAVAKLMQSFIEEARHSILRWERHEYDLSEIHENLVKAIINHDSQEAAAISRKHFQFIIDSLE